MAETNEQISRLQGQLVAAGVDDTIRSLVRGNGPAVGHPGGGRRDGGGLDRDRTAPAQPRGQACTLGEQRTAGPARCRAPRPGRQGRWLIAMAAKPTLHLAQDKGADTLLQQRPVSRWSFGMLLDPAASRWSAGLRGSCSILAQRRRHRRPARSGDGARHPTRSSWPIWRRRRRRSTAIRAARPARIQAAAKATAEEYGGQTQTSRETGTRRCDGVRPAQGAGRVRGSRGRRSSPLCSASSRRVQAARLGSGRRGLRRARVAPLDRRPSVIEEHSRRGPTRSSSRRPSADYDESSIVPPGEDSPDQQVLVVPACKEHSTR